MELKKIIFYKKIINKYLNNLLHFDPSNIQRVWHVQTLDVQTKPKPVAQRSAEEHVAP